MAHEIILPRFGNTVEECIIKLWSKKVGDTVSVDDVLCEVETDKTTVDVVSTESGILRHLFYEAHEVVKVLQPIAIVGSAEEDISSLVSQRARRPAQSAHLDAPPPSREAPVSVAPVPSSEHQERAVSFSPRAKTLLQKKGLSVDQFLRHFPVGDIRAHAPTSVVEEKDLADFFSQKLSHVTPAAVHMLVAQDRFLDITRGSGIHNAIIEKDIVGLPKCDEVVAQAVSVSPPGEAAQGLQGVEEHKRTPLHGVRKIISTRMMHSLRTTAQYTLHTEAPAKNIVAMKQQLKSDARPITLNDIILYFVSRVLCDNLWANAILENDTVISYRDVNIGCAVQTPKGLMVPVVARTQYKSLEEISQEMKLLIEESRNATISHDKLQNGTFTVSNLGSFGVHSFTPIINAPQTGILGVGAIQTRVVEAPHGDYAFEPCIPLSLTLDHSVHDGADGARLLNNFSSAIEQCSIEK